MGSDALIAGHTAMATLSDGAIAGIAVGASLVGLWIFCFVGICCYVQTRKRQNRDSVGGSSTSSQSIFEETLPLAGE